MSIFKKQTRQETIIYTTMWIIVFLAPLVQLIFNYDPNHPMWARSGLHDVWGSLLLFLLAFLIHNHILAPLLVKDKKAAHYIIGCVAVIAIFQTIQCSHKPKDVPHAPAIKNGMMAPPPPNGRPPIDKHDLTMFVMVIMMLGANLGTKFYFQSEEEKKHLAKLKEQSLRQELEYLRYQINPHFIMNTLNNIHALVDIDPEQAKDSIVDMSRMMRYLLYDSDNHYVTLNNALTFLKKYLNLMKLRYTDQVTVNVDIPEACPENVVLAPMLFIPFVENAFKHGVAYDKPSAINIDIEQKDGQLLFHCQNTKSNATHEYGGVGLNNVTKRLELIYGNDYSLDIDDGETTYNVTLKLPVKHPDDFKSGERGRDLDHTNR